MGKKYDLAIFDMDGTLTKANRSWRFILEEVGKENRETYRAFVNGEIDEAEFMRRDIALWKEAKPDVKAIDIALMMRNLPLIDGIQETVAALHYNNIKCVIISGGLMCAARMIADEFGFDEYIADDIESDENGYLTGNGIMNLDLSDKGATAKEFIRKYNTVPERTISIGNSFGDVSVFKTTGLSIAFNPLDMEITGASADHVIKSQNISDILDVILEVKD